MSLHTIYNNNIYYIYYSVRIERVYYYTIEWITRIGIELEIYNNIVRVPLHSGVRVGTITITQFQNVNRNLKIWVYLMVFNN